MNIQELIRKADREKALIFRKDDSRFYLMNPDKPGHQYRIDYDRIDTPEKILEWVAHLSGKMWVTRDMIFHLIDEASKLIGYEVYQAPGRWWMNKDGTLKCFGEAFSDYNQQSFHCAHLHDYGDCTEQVKGECWKRSKKECRDDKVRFREHEVKLTNQQIVEFAYLTKEVIESCIENNAKLSFERANCYPACFYKVREMLRLVDLKYIASHGRIMDFYQEGRELSNDFDRLKWETSSEEAGKTEETTSNAVTG